MGFDGSRVYTALTADMLPKGSKVIVSDDLAGLKEQVEASCRFTDYIDFIGSESEAGRFHVVNDGEKGWAFAYLLSKPKEVSSGSAWIAYLYRDAKCSFLTICPEGQWESVKRLHGAKTKYFVSDAPSAADWCACRAAMASVMAAHEDGKQIQFLEPGCDWLDCDPSWNPSFKYRVKPSSLKWTDLEIGDVLRSGTERRQVNGIDTSDEPDEDGDVCHVCLAGWWCTDKELEEWERELPRRVK